MPKAPPDLRSLARAHTELAIKTLAGIAAAKTSQFNTASARVSACVALLDRGWGKAAQPLTGADGSEDIQVRIRTIIDPPKKD